MVTAVEDIVATRPLSADQHAKTIRRAVFDCCKWDPQVGDVSVLAPFALVLSSERWNALRCDAEALAAETLAMEEELINRIDLINDLALPRPIRRLLRQPGSGSAPGIARVMRFDFHPTSQGWRISEVNSDVPGGFIEASGFTRLMADCYTGLRLCGDPAGAIVSAIARGIGEGGAVALVHATAYTDDRQAMIYLSRRFESSGVRTCLASPDQVHWIDGQAYAHGFGAVDAIFRFFPAEWLGNFRRATEWQMYFGGSGTPQCNPGASLLTQSKRLPLLWDRLQVRVPTWRRLLPTTVAADDANWRSDPEWIVKPALGRVGDSVGLSGITSSVDWKRIRRSLRWFGSQWVAQRRFQSVPVQTPFGPQHACIGVYTVDAVAAGIYGRIAAKPLIDGQARDVAVLVRSDEAEGTHNFA